jgi:hypothetical protein
LPGIAHSAPQAVQNLMPGEMALPQWVQNRLASMPTSVFDYSRQFSAGHDLFASVIRLVSSRWR